MKQVTLTFQEESKKALEIISDVTDILEEKQIKGVGWKMLETEEPLVSRKLRGM